MDRKMRPSYILFSIYILLVSGGTAFDVRSCTNLSYIISLLVSIGAIIVLMAASYGLLSLFEWVDYADMKWERRKEEKKFK